MSRGGAANTGDDGGGSSVGGSGGGRSGWASVSISGLGRTSYTSLQEQKATMGFLEGGSVEVSRSARGVGEGSD